MGLDLIHREVGTRLGLVRGERFVAATGMAFVSTLILALVTMGWFTTRSIEQANDELLESNAVQTAMMLAAQSEIRLQAGDISGLRRLMIDAAASGGVEHCAAVIPNGGVLASTVSSEITVDALDPIPNASTSTSERLVRLLDDGRVQVHEPLRMNDGSPVVLELTTGVTGVSDLASTVRTLSVFIGVAGLLITLGVYRRLRAKLGGIAAVSESLLAFQDGEQRVECLYVGEGFGLEAQAWNTILSQREAVDHLTIDNEIRETLLAHKSDGVGLGESCNALTQGIVIVDGAMNVLYANGAAVSFLNLPKTDEHPMTLADAEEGVTLQETVKIALEGESGSRNTVELGSKERISEGGTILRVSITQVRILDDRRAIMMIEDVTQQRLSDESRNSLMAQATHELRTPLTNIKLYVEEAIEAGADDEVLRDAALNVINKETRRLERVISDMMSVSEIEAGSLSIRAGDVRIDQMIDDLRADYQPQANEKSIKLEFDLPPKMPVLHADRDRISQALHNLIGNAIKYTPNDGEVRVEFEFDEHDSMSVRVVDSGIGISEEECEKIFEKFYRADDGRISDVTGSGLGLALAREIARLHGGEISVESQIDKGSTFTLFIPGHANEMMSKAA